MNKRIGSSSSSDSHYTPPKGPVLCSTSGLLQINSAYNCVGLERRCDDVFKILNNLLPKNPTTGKNLLPCVKNKDTIEKKLKYLLLVEKSFLT